MRTWRLRWHRTDLLLTVALVCALVLFTVVRQERQDAAAGLAALQDDAEKADRLLRQWQSLRAATGLTRQVALDVSLAALVEDIATRLSIRENLVAVAPGEKTGPGGVKLTTLQVSLRGVAYPALLRLLDELRTAPLPLVIQEYTVERRFDQPSLLDVSLLIAQVRLDDDATAR